MSHELRTPLTQIRMCAETLLLDRVRSDEERRRSLTVIDQETPTTAPYFMCFPNGCMADYEATADTINKMKKGQTLAQIRQADPVKGYRRRFGTDTGPWTTNQFIEAVYKSLGGK